MERFSSTIACGIVGSPKWVGVPANEVQICTPLKEGGHEVLFKTFRGRGDAIQNTASLHNRSRDYGVSDLLRVIINAYSSAFIAAQRPRRCRNAWKGHGTPCVIHTPESWCVRAALGLQQRAPIKRASQILHAT